MTLKTLTDDQVVVSRDALIGGVRLDGRGSDAKGVDGGSDADSSDQGTDSDSSDQGRDSDARDRGQSDHSADSDSSDYGTGESGSTTTPIARTAPTVLPASRDRHPRQSGTRA